jgi:hypothetical protein
VRSPGLPAQTPARGRGGEGGALGWGQRATIRRGLHACKPPGSPLRPGRADRAVLTSGPDGLVTPDRAGQLLTLAWPGYGAFSVPRTCPFTSGRRAVYVKGGRALEPGLTHIPGHIAQYTYVYVTGKLLSSGDAVDGSITRSGGPVIDACVAGLRGV